MKLIEILVKHIKRWPDGVDEIEMHDDGELFFDGNRAYGYSLPQCSDGWRRGKSSTFSNAVNREEYEAALAASKEMLVNKPVWDGQGLPPVGVECEIKRVADWMPVTIKFISDHHTVFTTFGGTEDCYQTYSLQFRPIRTEAERKRDAVIKAIYDILQQGTSNEDDANDIYRAIAAGKIPGVKLEAPDA